MKFEWKKQEIEFYGTKPSPSVIDVPLQKFITIDGKGDPNKEDFAQRVGVLYSVAYPVKMGYKAACKETGGCTYEDYAVYPLEGVWTSSDAENPLNKDSFIYTVMIRQPDFITEEMFRMAVTKTEKKKPHPFLGEIEYKEMTDGLCIQMLHVGPFDDEPESFAAMDKFAKKKGLVRMGHVHREIYLNDARRTAPAKRKTILRYRVRREK